MNHFIIEKGLNIIYSNVKAGMNSTGSKEFNRYFILINQIFKKRLETGLKVKIFEKLCQDKSEKERIKDFLLEDEARQTSSFLF